MQRQKPKAHSLLERSPMWSTATRAARPFPARSRGVTSRAQPLLSSREEEELGIGAGGEKGEFLTCLLLGVGGRAFQRIPQSAPLALLLCPRPLSVGLAVTVDAGGGGAGGRGRELPVSVGMEAGTATETERSRNQRVEGGAS